MSDAEKALAIWFQEVRYRHHAGGDNNELLDPVKVLNIYGYNTCRNDSIALATLWKAVRGGNQVSDYFDIETPRFAIERGPAWLKIDPATGLLSGTPDAAGRVAVAVTATIDREVRKLDEKALVWGREKVLSTATERVGAGTQKLAIDVQ